jgi:hypothetical protein
MRSHKVEQLGIATVGFFWCFLMWFSTAAFSPSIAATYHLTINDLGLLASSAIWMAPRAHCRRLGVRSIWGSADVRRDPCRLRTGFDRVGLHH